MTPHITLSMVVRNEADRYLERVLVHHRDMVDHVFILDDASTDQSIELCRDVLRGVPHTLLQNDASLFHEEHRLRRKQWDEALRTGATWLLVLDADELLIGDPKKAIEGAGASSQAIYMRLYDMWSETRFRSDSLWSAHTVYRPFLVNPDRSRGVTWHMTNQHCGRLPGEVYELPYSCSELRVQHLGWMTPGDRKKKHERYMTLDPEGRFGSLEQYRSILDPSPNLVRWDP